MQTEQLKNAKKVMELLSKNETFMQQVVTIDFSDSEIKVFIKHHRDVLTYLKKSKFKCDISDGGFIWCKRQFKRTNLFFVVW